MSVLMDQLTYFDPRLESADTKYYVYLYHVICRKGKKHYISYHDTSYATMEPINIHGRITGMYKCMFSSSAYICTDENTYFLDQNKKVTACNCICINVNIGRHYIILHTDRGVIHYNSAGNSRVAFNTKVIPSEQMVFANNCLIISGAHHSSCKARIKLPLIPHDLYFFESLGWIYSYDGVYCIFNNSSPANTINLGAGKIVKTFVDYGVATVFVTQRMFFLYDDNFIGIINKEIDDHYFIQKLFRMDATDASSIKQIIVMSKYYVVVGYKYLHIYDSNQCVARMDVEYNSVEIISNLWLNRLVLKYKQNLIVLGTNSGLVSANSLIIVKPLHALIIHGCYATLISPIDETVQLHYTYSKIFTLNNSNNKQDLNGINILAISNCTDIKINKPLQSIEICIDSEIDIFKQYFYTVITNNFKNNLRMVMVQGPVTKSAGIGTNRDIIERVLSYIKSDLLVSYEYGHRLNISHDFWRHNAFYFGKLLAYISNSDLTLPFHFNLSSLVHIYSVLKDSNDIGIDELAPFHNELHPQDFVSVRNLDNIYKTDRDQFASLTLGYDNFDSMIKSKLLSPVSEAEITCLKSIGKGILDFNNAYSSLNLWQLSNKFFGDITYDRKSALEFIKVSTEHSSLKSFIDPMIKFIHDLNNDELRQFMISVTGYHKRDKPVKVIIDKSDRRRDILIATCQDTLIVYSHVFQNEDFPHILKAYLCGRDMMMVD
jgi:hypothetical protein